MKTRNKFLIISVILGITLGAFAKDRNVKNIEYVIITQEKVLLDSAWKQVVDALLAKHKGAELYSYRQTPREAMEILRKNTPRYVAVVEKPEAIGADYIVDLNRMSREVDDDIYADFMYGIITGYDATAALRMVNNSRQPMVIHSAMATIKELKSAKWFDTFAYISDDTLGVCGEKEAGATHTSGGKVPHIDLNVNGKPAKAWAFLTCFKNFYKKYTPDLIVTASHATENNLEMPFSGGNILVENGQIYTDEPLRYYLEKPDHPRVYLPIGNCLLGNINNTKNSMAIGWMNNGGADALIGYVVPTWYGRAGWGGLKYWLTNPGRLTLAEAFFLNQQDMLHQINAWGPGLAKHTYQNDSMALINIFNEVQRQPTKDEVGFFHDRDVLAIYGDPAWNVRLKEITEENDFTVTSEIKGRSCMITITTKENFSMQRMAGNHFKEEHVAALPFSYVFPQPLKNPRLAKGQDWETAMDENFLLIYKPNFKPNQTYQIELTIDK